MTNLNKNPANLEVLRAWSIHNMNQQDKAREWTSQLDKNIQES
jgi:hypothetical protein